MYIIKIALRNLKRQKKRTILLGGAIAFGIMVITLVNGFTAGAAHNVKENFSYLLAGHIYISEETRRDDDTVISHFINPEIVEQALEQIGASPDTVVRRSTYSGQLLFSGRTSEQAVDGVDWNREPALLERMVLLEGSYEDIISDPLAVVVSEQAARRLQVQIGDDILVRMSTVTGQQNVGDLVVRGIMQDPGILGSMSSYAHIETVNKHLNLPKGSFQSIHIAVSDIRQVDELTELLHGILSQSAGVAPRQQQQDSLTDAAFSFVYQDQEEPFWEGSRFRISNINDFMGQIDQLASTLNIVSFVILIFLLLIIMVGIVNTFRMIMYERVKEIGTMRAVGMQRFSVKRMFLAEAFFLSAFGYVSGVLLALVISFILETIAVPLTSPFSLFTQAGRLTFPFPGGTMILHFFIISMMTLLAAYVPARKAARLQPADALRAVF